MLNQTAFVRRADHELRCRYVGLNTSIFRVMPHQFVICCDGFNGDKAEFEREFEDEIRPASLHAKISWDQAPKQYIETIPAIPLDNPVDGFRGMYRTKAQITDALTARFPNVEILGIEATPGLDFGLVAYVPESIDRATMAVMEAELRAMECGTDDVTVSHVLPGAPEPPAEERTAHPVLLQIDKNMAFTLEETEYWMAHADSIWRGDVTRADMSLVPHNKTICCLDYTWENSFELRCALPMFDVSYVILPFEPEYERFLARENLTESELIELAEMEKVVFVVSNSESRYPRHLLHELEANAPAQIMGRCGVNTVVASFLCETGRRFRENYPTALDLASTLRQDAESDGDDASRRFVSLLSWPLVAPSRAFQVLNDRGPLGYDLLGMGPVLDPAWNASEVNDMKLQLTGSGYSVFLASALDAALFPATPLGRSNSTFSAGYSDLLNIVSDILSSYWYDANTLSELQNVRAKTSRDQVLSRMLYCTNRDLSVVDVARMSIDNETPQHLGTLLAHMDQLSDKERKETLREYNHIIMELQQPRKGALLSALKHDWPSLALTVSGFLPLGPAFSIPLTTAGIIWWVVSNRRQSSPRWELKQIERALQAERGDSDSETIQDIHTFHKVSRVLGIKDPEPPAR